MNSLNIDFIENQWIPALRSGDYSQGSGALRTDRNDFCCLGVACDLLIKDQRLPDWQLNEYGRYAIDHFTGTLPDTALHITGLHSDSLSTSVGALANGVSFHDGLISLNDDLGYTFAEIADVLQQLVDEERAKATHVVEGA